MPVEYVCAVKKGHRHSCGRQQAEPPVCCGKPMTLELGALKAAAAPEPQAPGTDATAAAPRQKRE
ncbi:MAG: hypothetical protein PHU21_11560 [Elusimicrobia bacterium]|nr:hypothetical protein [Elusimicrobiota bacterium]